MDKIRHKGRFCRSGLFSKMKNLKQFSVKGGDTVTITDTGNLQAGDSSKSMAPPPPHIEEKEGINWKTGRRIVELGVLSESLDKKGCMACGNMLQLSNIVHEAQSCLANYFYIQCSLCACITQMLTGKCHYANDKIAKTRQ